MDLNDCLKLTEILSHLTTMYLFYEMYEDINKKINELKK